MEEFIEIVIASKNIHKIREYKDMFRELPNFDVLSLLDFPNYISKEEKGNSFRENAKEKALDAAKELNKLVLADDSGLIVPALNKEPGIYSARYAGKNATYADNRKKLLTNMENLRDEKRYAFFECHISLASPECLRKEVSAICEGMIMEKERGGGGFGYDSLFSKHGYNKTFAELDSFLKNKISHRRKAFDKMKPFLESLFKEF